MRHAVDISPGTKKNICMDIIAYENFSSHPPVGDFMMTVLTTGK